jgi:hypothetical protein
MSFTAEAGRQLIGRAFPGGTYTIEPWRAWLTHDAILAPTSGALVHPVFVFLAATGSMGMTWDDLFAWFGASADDGPMFGDCHISITRPLQVGQTYRVSGRILFCERKSGQRLGAFDLVGYVLELSDFGGSEAVASCRNSIVFPRRAS